MGIMLLWKQQVVYHIRITCLIKIQLDINHGQLVHVSC